MPEPIEFMVLIVVDGRNASDALASSAIDLLKQIINVGEEVGRIASISFKVEDFPQPALARIIRLDFEDFIKSKIAVCSVVGFIGKDP